MRFFVCSAIVVVVPVRFYCCPIPFLLLPHPLLLLSPSVSIVAPFVSVVVPIRFCCCPHPFLLLFPSVSVVVPIRFQYCRPIRFQYCRPRSLSRARMLPACVSMCPSFSGILWRGGSSSASSGRPNPFCRLRHAPNIQTLINLLINNSYMSEKNSNFAFGNIQKQ